MHFVWGGYFVPDGAAAFHSPLTAPLSSQELGTDSVAPVSPLGLVAQERQAPHFDLLPLPHCECCLHWSGRENVYSSFGPGRNPPSTRLALQRDFLMFDQCVNRSLIRREEESTQLKGSPICIISICLWGTGLNGIYYV